MYWDVHANILKYSDGDAATNIKKEKVKKEPGLEHKINSFR